MFRWRFFSAAIVVCCLIGPNISVASAKDGGETAAGDGTAEAPSCHKIVGVKGRPHRIHTIASLSAVRLWTQKAMKHGEAYSMWHNARATSVKCEKLPRSDYYACFASAKPCRAARVRSSASAKIN